MEQPSLLSTIEATSLQGGVGCLKNLFKTRPFVNLTFCSFLKDIKAFSVILF